MKTRYVGGWRMRWVEGTVPEDLIPKAERDWALLLRAVGAVAVIAGLAYLFLFGAH